MEHLIFHSAQALLRSVILVIGSYIGLIVLLRLTGKRTLSKMNAFDLVVTVALGSTLATIALSKDTDLMQGLLVLTFLVVMQYVVAWLSVRFRVFSKVVKATPVYVFKDGDFQKRALLQERVTEEEVLAAGRSEGVADFSGMHAVILETDGSFSVIKQAPKGKSTLQPVANVE